MAGNERNVAQKKPQLGPKAQVWQVAASSLFLTRWLVNAKGGRWLGVEDGGLMEGLPQAEQHHHDGGSALRLGSHSRRRLAENKIIGEAPEITRDLGSLFRLFMQGKKRTIVEASWQPSSTYPDNVMEATTPSHLKKIKWVNIYAI